jgi:cell division protein FtsL
MQTLKEGSQALNFKKVDFKVKLNEIMNMDISLGTNKEKLERKPNKPKKEIDFSFNKPLDMKEKVLLRVGAGLILVNIIFVIFSSILYKQMENKQDEIKSLIVAENGQIQKMNNDINSLNSKNTKYQSLISDLKTINQKISNIAESKNSIPNLLNQIMFIIPETVQLTSIQNTTDKKVVIVAKASDYDQLGYFIAKIKVDGILKNTVSSSGQKSADTVTVTIEGELP